MNRAPDLDDRDIAILEALQDDGRLPLTELGRRIGLSQPAVSERVKRLEDHGIILGYTARIDPKAAGLGLTAVIRLKTTHEHIRPCLQRFAEMPQIIDVCRVTGDDCFVLRAVLAAPEDLAVVIDAIGQYGPVTTSVVLRHERPKPLTAALLKPSSRSRASR